MQRLNIQRNAAFLAILAASIAVFLTALDQTVVVTALPQIIVDLQIPLNQLDRAAWIITAVRRNIEPSDRASSCLNQCIEVAMGSIIPNTAVVVIC